MPWHPTAGKIVVLGDIPLLDGVLAWRLNGVYVQVNQLPEHVPYWPRILLWAGSPFSHLFLKSSNSNGRLWTRQRG